MALKRKTRRNELFSMASMTDVIFLLLIFFMVLSTLVVPNAIKVNLPSSQSTKPTESTLLRVTIDADNNYFVSYNNEAMVTITKEDLPQFLAAAYQQDSTTYVALYADESVAYKSIVEFLNMASSADLKVVLATRAQAASEATNKSVLSN